MCMCIYVQLDLMAVKAFTHVHRFVMACVLVFILDAYVFVWIDGMCVCVYVCEYVFASVCARVCMWICSVCICVCMRERDYTCVCVFCARVRADMVTLIPLSCYL